MKWSLLLALIATAATARTKELGVLAQVASAGAAAGSVGAGVGMPIVDEQGASTLTSASTVGAVADGIVPDTTTVVTRENLAAVGAPTSTMLSNGGNVPATAVVATDTRMKIANTGVTPATTPAATPALATKNNTKGSTPKSAGAVEPANFWTLPDGPVSTDEMAGWVPIETDSDIPTGFCLTGELQPATCGAGYFSFGVFHNGKDARYPYGASSKGLVPPAADFDTNSLLRYSLVGGENNAMYIYNTAGDAFWGIGDDSLLAYVPQENATAFVMYKQAKGGDAILLKGNGRFVGMYELLMYTSVSVTSSNILWPARPKYYQIEGVIDAMDAQIMGYRVNALLNNGPLYPTWMAYDLALVLPLQGQPNAPKFTKFKMEGAGEYGLIMMFTTLFRLIADKMTYEYLSYESLGRNLPRDLSIEKVVANIGTIANTSWSYVMQASATMNPTYVDGTYRARVFGGAVFASAKFKELENPAATHILSEETEKKEDLMALYYRCSCALAWDEYGLTLRQKLNLTEILDTSFSPSLLTTEDSENPQIFWFSQLLNATDSVREGPPKISARGAARMERKARVSPTINDASKVNVHAVNADRAAKTTSSKAADVQTVVATPSGDLINEGKTAANSNEATTVSSTTSGVVATAPSTGTASEVARVLTETTSTATIAPTSSTADATATAGTDGSTKDASSGPESSSTQWANSQVLVELGLMLHLDAEFVAANSIIGESIAEPLFARIDEAMDATTGMDVNAIYGIISDSSTYELMDLVDEICNKKLTEITLCLLPQIFRQAGTFSMYDRDITDPKVVTNLQSNPSIDSKKYLDLLVQDETAAALEGGLQTAKVEFVGAAKNLTESLSEIVEDSVIETAVESSKQIAATTSALTTFMASGAKFAADGLNAQLRQYMAEIRAGQERVDSTRGTLVSELKAIATLAQIRAAIDAFVSVVEGAFAAFDAADALASPTESLDLAGVGGVVSGFETAVHKVTDAADTFELAKYASELSQELSEIISRMQTAAPAIQRVREAAAPLTGDVKLNDAELARAGDEFLEALKEYKAPVSVAELNSLQSRFDAVSQKFCIVAEMPTDNNCINLPGHIELIFTALVDNTRKGEDVMQLLMDICVEAVNTRTLNVLNSKVLENEAEAVDLTEIKKTWVDDAKKKQTWWLRWQKKQRYLTAAATTGSILQRVRMLSAVIDICDSHTYNNAGVPGDTCKSTIYAGNPVTQNDISRLQSMKDTGPTALSQRIDNARIPTAPSYAGDLAYIDLPKLMDGQSVYFKLPANNVSWLLAHNWISSAKDISEHVNYVTGFQLFLPPRFADYAKTSATVTIDITSRPTSDMGPALKGKRFLIPPVSYRFEYQQSVGQECEKLPYHCDSNLPGYCIQNNGTPTKKDTLPSLFSEWMVTAVLNAPDGSAAQRIAYSKAATHPMLYATVNVDRVRVAGASNRNLREKNAIDRRSLRGQSTASRCCSKPGTYANGSHGVSGCSKCPKGAISQLGGLFCAMSPATAGVTVSTP